MADDTPAVYQLGSPTLGVPVLALIYLPSARPWWWRIRWAWRLFYWWAWHP